VYPVPDPLLLRKFGSVGDRPRVLWICSQKLATRPQRRSSRRYISFKPRRLNRRSPNLSVHFYSLLNDASLLQGLTQFETSRMLSLNVICQFWVFVVCIIWYMSTEVTDVSSLGTIMSCRARGALGGGGARIPSIGYIRPLVCKPNSRWCLLQWALRIGHTY
jgi:hypothetical protein